MSASSCRVRAPARMLSLVLAGIFAAGVACVSAQTLGDVAKKEEQRRKQTKAAGKVYTNKDLGPGGTSPTPPPSTAAPAAETTSAATEADKKKPEEEDPTKTEAYWRDRMNAAKADLERNQVMLDALQSRVNQLATDFVNRDDPAQRAAIANDRQRALDEMSRTRDAIDKLKQSIVDIEEEARKAGVPPGWLR